jgi:predicted phosphodiesterase
MTQDDEEEPTQELSLDASIDRLVVLGDPHGDLLGLHLALDRETRPGTAFVSVGDNVGYADGPLSSALCQVLEERSIPSVRGNHEVCCHEGRLMLSEAPSVLTPEAWAWCQTLPHRISVSAEARPEVTMRVVHTLPFWQYVDADSAERLADIEDVQVTFCGHTHKPAIYEVRPALKRPKARRLNPVAGQPLVVPLRADARYVVDAGSLARPAGVRGGVAMEHGTYAVFDLAANQLELHAVDKRPELKAMFKAMLGPPR